MPLYDYDCAACGRRIEVVHGVHAPGPVSCPNCGGGPLKKAITAPAVHFKGSGWAKKERRVTAPTGASKSSGDSPADAGDTSIHGTSDKGAGGSGEAASTPAAATIGTGTATKTD